MPASAVVEDGRQSIVFVQPDPEERVLFAAARGRGLAEPERGPSPLAHRLGGGGTGPAGDSTGRAGRRRGSHPVAFRPGRLDRVAKAARQGGGLIGDDRQVDSLGGGPAAGRAPVGRWRWPPRAAMPSCTSTSRPIPTRPRRSSKWSPSIPGLGRGNRTAGDRFRWKWPWPACRD